MKKFTFSLDRVLEFRRSQARIEEVKLEHLYAERAAIDLRERTLREEHRQTLALSVRQGEQAGGISGEELAALDRFGHHMLTEFRRCAQSRASCAQRMAAQLQAVAAKRRDVKLLERLKHQGRTAWDREFEREIAQSAEEAHLAKWIRENIQ